MVIDLEHGLIPNKIVYPSMIIALLISLYHLYQPLYQPGIVQAAIVSLFDRKDDFGRPLKSNSVKSDAKILPFFPDQPIISSTKLSTNAKDFGVLIPLISDRPKKFWRLKNEKAS